MPPLLLLCNVYVDCEFDKIKDIFQGFGILVSSRLQKDGGAKSKQMWMTFRTGTEAAEALIVRSYYYFCNHYATVQLVKRDIVTAVI